MSEKTIELVINTSRGEKNLKQIERLAQRVEKSLGKINKIKINVKTDQAQKKLSALTKEINKGNRKIDTFFKGANPGMTAFGNKISKVRDELSSVRKAFDDASSAVERQRGATALLAGNFKKLRMEAVAFAKASGADPSLTIGSVSARIKEIQQFPRTILAGNEAMSLLKRMQEMTIVGSKEFLEVSKAIGVQLGINANIQSQAARAAKPFTSSTAFVSQAQLRGLKKGETLIPPSRRLPAAGETAAASGAFRIVLKEPTLKKAVNTINKNSAKTANILAQQSINAGFTGATTGGFGVAGGQIGPRDLTRAERFGFGKSGKQSGLFAFPGGRNARIKGGIGSALIGGGFPALFGAGGISSILGAVAGGAGGALAPGGGFAASIAATAIAAQIEKAIQFRKAINKLNEEMVLMGVSSNFSRRQIKELAKEFEITNDEAIKLASEFKTFGADFAKRQFAAFGQNAKLIFDNLSGLRDTESVLGKINNLSEQISETKRREILQTLATEGSLKAQIKLQNLLLQKNKQSFIDEKMKTFTPIGSTGAMGSTRTLSPKESLAIEKQRIERIKELGLEFDKNHSRAIRDLETQIKINEQLQFISEFQAPTDQLREMLSPMRQILDLSVSIRDGFEESFKGIIKGTMTVSEAFRSMLNRIADHFLDAAARMAATQIQKGFLGLFSNMFNFSQSPSPKNPVQLGGLPSSPGINLPSSPKSVIPSLNQSPSNTMIPSTLPKFPGFRADGGPVKRGGSFIVGERGPELFSPGVSGMITPNHALGGSTSVVVNVDASGSSVEGDEQGGRELGRLISVAIQSELIQQKRPGGLLA